MVLELCIKAEIRRKSGAFSSTIETQDFSGCGRGALDRPILPKEQANG
jgi:hypothetical protein